MSDTDTDAGEQATFQQYGYDVAPPRVSRKRIVTVQADKQRLAGFIGTEQRREMRVYTTRRSDFHYYYEGDGYAISESVLDECAEWDVARVLIHEKLTEFEQRQDDVQPDVFEFRLRQYTSSDNYIPEGDLLDEQDAQVYVPLDDAMYVWSDHDVLFERSFESAVEAIDWRGWDN